MKSNLISRAWLSLERAYQRAHHSQLYQLKLFSAYTNSIGNPEPSQIRTEVSNDQRICFKCIRLKPPSKYICVSSICLLLSEALECAKVMVSRYFHHQKIQASFLQKGGELSPPAHICRRVNSVPWSFTSDTAYLHPSYLVPAEIHSSEAVAFSLGLFFPLKTCLFQMSPN